MAKIKRLGVLKMASFMGLYGAFVGLLLGIFSAFILPFLVASFGIPGELGGGSLSIIFYPVFYGIGGFIGGLILTPIINLILKIIKGIDLDIEMDGSSLRTQTPRQP